MDRRVRKDNGYVCAFCGFSSELLDDFEEDYQLHRGYWCPVCEGFNNFNQQEISHQFKLILEKKVNNCRTDASGSRYRPGLKVQVSPLRWPGGKSRLAGDILQMCDTDHMLNFIEPFAGGGSVGLSLLMSGNIKELYLNDKDYGIYSLFQVIKTDPFPLLELIDNFVPSKEEYRKAQTIVNRKYVGCDLLAAAWNLLITNRLSFSGIVKANCMSDPAARWTPKTLRKRILDIHSYSSHIHLSNQDACEFIEEMYWMPHATLFIDPPYYEKGKQLYSDYYTEEEHEKLAFLLENLYKGFPGTDIILTYDDNPYIRNLYQYPTVEVVERKYSIVTHLA